LFDSTLVDDVEWWVPLPHKKRDFSTHHHFNLQQHVFLAPDKLRRLTSVLPQALISYMPPLLLQVAFGYTYSLEAGILELLYRYIDILRIELYLPSPESSYFYLYVRWHQGSTLLNNGGTPAEIPALPGGCSRRFQ